MAENEKQTNKERLKDITDSIERGIQDLFQSDKYAQYLRTMSRFHKYSVNNTMLIYMQKPDATLVAGFNKWRDQFERNVMKGEKGIKIIAPTPFKKKIEEQKLDPDTNLPMLDADGKVITEEKEVKIPIFRPVTVFDVSQTQGKPLPQLASDLCGNVQNYEVFMEALRRSSPVPIQFKPLQDGSDGFFSLDDQSITIREGMSEVQTVSAVLHEIAHSKLHNQKKVEEPKDATKYQEVEIFDIPALFSNGRISLADLPDGLYRYDLRGSDYDPGMPVTVEQNVAVNHAGAIITAKPLDLGEDGRLYLTEDEGLNFVGGEISVYRFLNEQRKDRNTEEVEAESTSFAVCAYYGIATGENSFGYIATWSKDKKLKELRASLETINKTSSELITDIDRHYAQIVKEKGIALEAKEQQFEKVYVNLTPDAVASFSQDFATAVLQMNHEGANIMGMGNTAEEMKQWATEHLQNHDLVVIKDCLSDVYHSDHELTDEISASIVSLLGRLETLGAYEYVPNKTEPQKEETRKSEDALYLVDDTLYLHVQPTEGGWDYTIYDKESKKLLDGGVIDTATIEESPVSSVAGAVRTEVFVIHGMTPEKVTFEDISLVEELQAAQTVEAAAEQPTTDEIIDAIAHTVQEEPVQAPDNGYMPDPSMSVEAMNAYGYTDDKMLPLSKERAMELIERDVTVYMLYDDNSEAMAFEPEDVQLFSGMFGIEREEWERVRGEIPPMDEALLRQKQEQAFQSGTVDSFAIYQLKHDNSTMDLRFMNSEWMQSKGLIPEKDNYEMVYTGTLQTDGSVTDKLEGLFYTFNQNRPEDFRGHSLSVSDIVALKQQGVISYHYVDSIGYKELPFFDKSNYLKTAEMQLEDDYGMIDGIVNNGARQAEKLEKKPPMRQLDGRSNRPSVLEKLRKYQEEAKTTTAKHRSAERDEI